MSKEMKFGFYKMRGISGLGEQLSISPEGSAPY
jgi:hypothetical protein